MINEKQKNSKPKKLKPITYTYLQNVALWYVERFGGTEKNLRDILKKRIYASMRHYPKQDTDTIQIWIDDIVKSAKNLNYVNDTTFAVNMVRRLAHSGHSKKMIALKLQQKGISDTDSKCALQYLSHSSELSRAVAYARKRRFGIYCTNEKKCTDSMDKHISSMIRRGFSYTIAKQALYDPYNEERSE